MRRVKKVLVVGNYRLDNIQSMERYANLLERIYRPVARVHQVKPAVLVGNISHAPPVLRKYLGYIDKYIIFFLWLLVASRRGYDYIHVADHGNSLYAFACPRAKFIITCHDVLAIRAARGDTSAGCYASALGKYLQAVILLGLRFAKRIVFVSDFTLHDYKSLAALKEEQEHIVIRSPLNARFRTQPNHNALTDGERQTIERGPFLLMVGSSLPRKNRGLSLRLIFRLSQTSCYHLVLAGSELSQAERTIVEELQLTSLVSVIIRPRHELLNVLYCKAHALLFPSLSEGFGWPLLEAQTCLCPIIASKTTSIPEVAGVGALYAEPSDIDSFYSHVLSLENAELRRSIVKLGLDNVKRYDYNSIAARYQMLISNR